MEIFLVRIFLYSVRIQENTDQKKLRIWTLHAVKAEFDKSSKLVLFNVLYNNV